jgi:hypothetical protein
MEERGLDLSDLRYGELAGCCKDRIEFWRFIKYGKAVNTLRNVAFSTRIGLLEVRLQNSCTAQCE